MKADEWIWLVGINNCPNFITVIAITYVYLWLFVVQSLSHVWLFAKLWTAAHQASLSFTISRSFLKLMSTEFQWCHPTISSSVVPFSSCPQSFPISGSIPMRGIVLCIRWTKYWSFSFNISLSNEYSGLISFRIDSFDLLAVQGTLRVFFNITIQKHQFFGTQPSLWSNSHIHTWLLEKQ